MSRNPYRSQATRGRSSVTNAVSAVLRSRSSLSDALLAVHRCLAAHPAERLAPLTSAVASNTFKIDPDNFGEALPLEIRHLRQLESLLQVRSPEIEDNYLLITSQFILENRDAVDRLIDFEQRASGLALEAEANEIKQHLLDLSAFDKQSMVSIKLYAALHSYSDDVIRDFLESNLTSSWTTTTLIYPLLYYFSSLPNERSIDKMLLQFIPKSKIARIERDVVKFLLEPQEDWVGGLSLRCYLGLLSHPYDAIEYLTSDLEIAISSRRHLTARYLQAFKALAEAFPKHRIGRAYQIASGQPVATFDGVVPGIVGSSQKLATQLKIIEGALDLSRNEIPKHEASSVLMQSLVSVRWSRYPTQVEFDELSAFRQRYGVLTAARVVDSICRGLFLFSRDEPEREKLALVRAAIALNPTLEFLCLSPGGYQALRADFPTAIDRKNVETNIRGLARDRTDRVWIMEVNWRLSELQSGGKVLGWAALARESFPIWVHPRYLSGLDWYWLAEVERQVGVTQFRGNPDFTYVLFLRLLEQFLRESVSLRLVVEPVARKLGIEDFAKWLAEQFDTAALAFVRLFLNPETILKLRLAGNYTAALTTRIVLLEDSIRRFGFQPSLFSEEDLVQEQNALTATLSRMSVGARQFEIPWAILKVDANARVRDTYSTHVAMMAAIGDAQTTSVAKRLTSYPYTNGASIEYEATNRDLSFVFVIAGIVDTFLTHPSAGIESILSVRIRHDSFRRELAYALAGVQSSEIPNVSFAKAKNIIRDIDNIVRRDLQAWLDDKMHTWRKDKPNGIFHIVPTRQNMTELLAICRGLSSLDEIIEAVFGWLKLSLDTELDRARTSLTTELYPLFEKRIDSAYYKASGRSIDTDTALVSQAAKTGLQRRLSELEEWFRVPDEDHRLNSLRVGEVIHAVEQRFWPDISAGRVTIDRGLSKIEDSVVAPHHIRPLYDLLSEAVYNSLKHSRTASTRVRLRYHSASDGDFISISNRCGLGPTVEKMVTGHPYTSLNDALFAEGESGLEKIAYLAAYLSQQIVNIRTIRRARAFHILMPAAMLSDIVSISQ